MNAQPLSLEALEERLATVEARLAGLNDNERMLLSEELVADIVADAASMMGLRARDIVSERRFAHLFRARAAVAWVAKQTTGYSLPRIGRALGRLDHTTVLNQLRRAEEMRQSDPAFRTLTDQLHRQAEQRGTQA